MRSLNGVDSATSETITERMTSVQCTKRCDFRHLSDKQTRVSRRPRNRRRHFFNPLSFFPCNLFFVFPHFRRFQNDAVHLTLCRMNTNIEMNPDGLSQQLPTVVCCAKAMSKAQVSTHSPSAVTRCTALKRRSQSRQLPFSFHTREGGICQKLFSSSQEAVGTLFTHLCYVHWWPCVPGPQLRARACVHSEV